MEGNEFLKRVHELYNRSADQGIVTSTFFLTPAEQYALLAEAKKSGFYNLLLFGGSPESERKIAFFLPFYIEPEDFEPEEYICAVFAETKFATPGHRDYLGALLGLGIKRECLGDIVVLGEKAYFFCIPSVLKHILLNFDKVGRNGVRARQVALSQVPAIQRNRKEVSFTLKSPRLDAAAAGIFSVSRTRMAEMIAVGAVSLNYKECTQSDTLVKEGDILSARGYGKAEILSVGGKSRKDRLFMRAEIYQ